MNDMTIMIICLFPTNLSVALGFSFLNSDFKENWFKYLVLGLLFVGMQWIMILLGISFNTVYAVPIGYIGMVLFYFLLFKENLTNSILAFFLATIPQILYEYSLLSITTTFFNDDIMQVINNDQSRLIICFSFLLFHIILKIIVPFKQLLSPLKPHFPVFSLVGANILLYVLCYRLMLDSYRFDYIPSISYFLFLLLIIMAINSLMVMNFINNYNEIKKVKEYGKLKEDVLPLIENNIQLQHDFKNHLATLKLSIANDNSDESLYIDSLTEEINNNNEHMKWNNPILGALIHQKRQEASSLGIKFITTSHHVDTKFPVEDYNLISIVSNLLDNAFEAVSRLSTEKREVFMTIGLDEKIFISVNNSVDIDKIDLSKIFKKGYSTKWKSRGYGLSAVKNIVDKSKGNIEIYPSKDMLEIKITFDYPKNSDT